MKLNDIEQALRREITAYECGSRRTRYLMGRYALAKELIDKFFKS